MKKLITLCLLVAASAFGQRSISVGTNTALGIGFGQQSAPTNIVWTGYHEHRGSMVYKGAVGYQWTTNTGTSFSWSTNGARERGMPSSETYTFSNVSNDVVYVIDLIQPAAGNAIPTWPAGIVWVGATNQSTTPISINTNSGARTRYVFERINGVTYANVFSSPSIFLVDFDFGGSGISSARLAERVTDESGTGGLIFAGGNIGAATATTPAANDNDTSVATTAYVQGEISGLGGGGGLTDIITADQATTSGTAVNVTDAVFSIGANENWTAEFHIRMTLAGVGADPKFALDVPTGATVIGQVWGNSAGSIVYREITADATLTTGTIGGTPGSVVIYVSVQNGANAGSVQLQFASGDGATSTSVKAGSYWNAREVP